MNTITVKYFASVREAVGQGSELWATTASTLGELRAELVARGGAYAQALAAGQAVRMAQNQTMSNEASVLMPSAEVAFFPPVTGG
jgi:sulfur-carrier protein